MVVRKLCQRGILIGALFAEGEESNTRLGKNQIGRNDGKASFSYGISTSGDAERGKLLLLTWELP